MTVLSVSQYYLLWCFNIYTCLYFYVLRFLYVHLHFVTTFWPYYPLIFGYIFCICVYMTYLLWVVMPVGSKVYLGGIRSNVALLTCPSLKLLCQPSFESRGATLKEECVTQLIYHYNTLGSLSRTEVRSDVSAHKIYRFSFEVAPSNLGMSGANPSLD